MIDKYRSTVEGFCFGVLLTAMVWAGWYSFSTKAVIAKLVEEKAQAVGRANQAEQESATYKAAAEHWFAVANSQPQQAVNSINWNGDQIGGRNAGNVVNMDPAVGVLNTIRPGLGTLASAANQAWQQHQAQQPPKCPPGQFASRFGNEPWTCKQDSPAPPPAQKVVTTLSASCRPNELMINGECLPCGSGLHPGLFPDGSAGCIR